MKMRLAMPSTTFVRSLKSALSFRTVILSLACVTIILYSSSLISVRVDKVSGMETTEVQQEVTTKNVELSECGCTRKIKVVMPDLEEDEPRLLSNSSSCSPSSFARGRGQKVISYSLYEPPSGPNKTAKWEMYAEGLSTNVDPIRDLYGPDWVIRVYHDLDNVTTLCSFACSNPQIDLCDVRKNPLLGDVKFVSPRIWRFFPGLDEQVSLFLSRDLDSVVSRREVAAVEEFISSGVGFHVMRDHPAHTASIMAGMWGARLKNATRARFVKAFKKMFKKGILRRSRRGKGTDQEVLNYYFWPWARRHAMAHDSYFCQKKQFEAAAWRPFPTQREDKTCNFVGSVLRNSPKLVLNREAECPEKCRPPEHQDWKYC